MQKQLTGRYPTLDYLRGLMALAVLAFHYDKWLSGVWLASGILGRLGVYAVSVFFVLSGLTLTLVYENRIDQSLGSWKRFFVKRFYRIFPLLWLATLGTLLLDDQMRPFQVIAINLSGLFGFINPAKDIATGAWSIGCELVFYAIFPFLLLLAKRNSGLIWLAFLAFSGFACWAAFAWFSTEQQEQSFWWEAYVQAGYHAFFFVGGMALAIYRHKMAHLSRFFWIGLLLTAGLGFCFWPVPDAPYYLVSGLDRVVLSLLSLLVVAAYFQSALSLKGRLHTVFGWLGTVSYSLYLLHPLVFRVVKFAVAKLGLGENYPAVFIPALGITLVVSHLSFRYLEQPLMRKGV